MSLTAILSSAEASAGYLNKNSNNLKNRKRAVDDGKRERLPFLSCPALSYSFFPASLRHNREL